MNTPSPAGEPAARSPHTPSGRDPFRRWFWIFAVVHLAVWVLVPVLTHPNAPLDVVEIVYWGHEWQWGYVKHPPLPSWLSEAAVAVSADS